MNMIIKTALVLSLSLSHNAYAKPQSQNVAVKHKRDFMFNEYCLASTIWEEARSDSKKGAIIVSEVTMNRAADVNIGNRAGKGYDTVATRELDLCSVIKTKHQFSWYKTHGLWLARAKIEPESWKNAVETAKKY